MSEVELLAPIENETWVAGEEIKIEWLLGETPVELTKDYPEYMNIYALNKDKSIYRTIAQGNPSKWARWIYDLPLDWESGSYHIRVCDSLVPSDCQTSPLFSVRGQDKATEEVFEPKSSGSVMCLAWALLLNHFW